MSHDHATDRNILEARAYAWMETHAEAMLLFEKLAVHAANRGRKFGMKLLAERIRWEFSFEREDGELFKLNNSYVAYIGRELIRRYPHLERYIELRTIHEDHDLVAEI